MKRFHVHLAVDDLAANIRFYSTVFGMPPTVEKTDYAKWMLDDPRINFAVSSRGMKAGVDHLGVQVETDEELAALREQRRASRHRRTRPGRRGLLLRQVRQVLGHRSAGHRVGDLPHARQHPHFRHRRSEAGRQRMLRTAGAGHLVRQARRAEDLLLLEDTMSDRTYNVLFLCTGNSARSILAEVIMNQVGGGRFKAYSAGSQPNGRVNPFAIELLSSHKLPVEGLRSKSWDEFAAPGAPHLDFVFTVCDNAAGEVCPMWPGQPMTAHWGVEDPAAVEGTDDEKRRAFAAAYTVLRNRIQMFASLKLASLDRLALTDRLREIGRSGTEQTTK